MSGSDPDFEFDSSSSSSNASEDNDFLLPDIETLGEKFARQEWKAVWKKIEIMRKANPAPVDTMGCERLSDSTDPKQNRFETLVALMLSSQTRDEQTAKTMAQLKQHGCRVDRIHLETSDEQLKELIYGVGFHNRKVLYIKKTAKILYEQYDQDIPSTLKGLLALPGVGPKMAHLCLQCAWGKTEGIGVDVHVHRIANRLGWVDSKNPEGTRKQLEAWLPKSHWRDINSLLVGFGQTICTPRNPKCNQCSLAYVCPSSTVKKQKMMKSKTTTKSTTKSKSTTIDKQTTKLSTIDKQTTKSSTVTKKRSIQPTFSQKEQKKQKI